MLEVGIVRIKDVITVLTINTLIYIIASLGKVINIMSGGVSEKIKIFPLFKTQRRYIKLRFRYK